MRAGGREGEGFRKRIDERKSGKGGVRDGERKKETDGEREREKEESSGRG